MEKSLLAQRMKEQYEDVFRYYLPRRTFSILRLDMRCGHSYCKNLQKPFDAGYIEDINLATIKLMLDAQGARFAYLQSDEISILLTDFENINSASWFDGNIQKIASISSSILTAQFNKLRIKRAITENIENIDELKMANFDSRVFVIPDWIEVYNYFVWRNKDAIRNSISSLASVHFSHKQLLGTHSGNKKEMLDKIGFSWDNLPNDQRFGRLIVKIDNKWKTIDGWEFTQNQSDIMKLIPSYN
jgi:tRNA(His) 5'-end guanylyltransferase